MVAEQISTLNTQSFIHDSLENVRITMKIFRFVVISSRCSPCINPSSRDDFISDSKQEPKWTDQKQKASRGF